MRKGQIGSAENFLKSRNKSLHHSIYNVFINSRLTQRLKMFLDVIKKQQYSCKKMFEI